MSETKIISIPLTSNPTYEHRTPKCIQHAHAKHTPTPSPHKPKFLSRFKMDALPSPKLDEDKPRYIETLTDVDRDIQYYAQVEFGSRDQRLRLDFDTGSSDLWVPDWTCKTKRARFVRHGSTTFKRLKGKFQITYGDGSRVEGIMGQDRVNVAGLVIEDQTFGLATRQSASFSNDVVDGVLGLAYNTLSCVPGTLTVMDNMIKQNLIQMPVFSVWLGRSTEGGGGEYRFGGYDRDRFEGELTWVPVTVKRYWQIKCDGVFFGDVDLNMSSDVIIDTGTTLVIVPTAVAKAIHDQIPGAVYDYRNGWIIPDTPEVAAMGGFQFVLGGVKFDVVMKDMLREKVLDRPGFVYSGVASSDRVTLWILGDVFIKQNYCVFDLGQDRIGIAPCIPPNRALPETVEQKEDADKTEDTKDTTDANDKTDTKDGADATVAKDETDTKNETGTKERKVRQCIVM